jgi:hypothetical protein
MERLRDGKHSRPFFRLASSVTIESEFRGQWGHPSSYAFVRLECVPADDLSFESHAKWPSTVSDNYRAELEQSIAESVADELLSDVYQHSGCAVALVEVGFDDVGSSVAAFMRATKSAMKDLLASNWTAVPRSPR